MAEEKRSGPRVEAELGVRLAYGSVGEFVERHALNVSRGGIFVRSRDALSVGARVAFDLQLESGERVIRGMGVVTSVVPPSAPGEPPRAPGMGIKFTTLDEGSRAIVDLMVASRGGEGSGDEPPQPGAEAHYAEAGTVSVVVPDAAGEATSSGVRPERPRRSPSRQVVGIDLGTTNSCVAVMEGGRARVIASKLGHTTVPSVVAYDADGRLLVGRAARAQMVANPRNTVYGAKRLVGRPFASPTVQDCRDRFHYEIVEGEGGAAAVRFAGRVFTLQHIAAYVLGELREMASEALGEEVTRAAITVPAYYNDHQRQAVREAGRLAGLRVERIVNEPTAAAVAFGFGRGLEQRVLVYDLGGGTFDASVVEIQGDVYEVVSTGGDTFLGGVDFDNQLVDHLVYAFQRRHGFAPPDDLTVWQRIIDAAEETKVALSTAESAVARIPQLCSPPGGGSEVGLEVEVSRAELEELTLRLVDRSIEVCHEVLKAKGLTSADLDEVLLVGGQSRMPLVWRRIRAELGKEPSKSVHPEEAVALGAALLADADTRIDSVVLLDALAISIGVGLPGGRMVPVLPRNTRLPARRTYELATGADGQTEVELAVFQGESPQVTECEYLGSLKIGGLPPASRGQVKVAVEFRLGTEGILSVHARNGSTGKETAVELSTVDTPASLREKLQLPAAPVAPRGSRPIDAERQGRESPAPAAAPRPGQPAAELPGQQGARAPAEPSPEPAARKEKKSLLARLFGRS
jgi:molecular chaperone DnaK